MDDIDETIAYWRDERVTTREVLESMGYEPKGSESWAYVRDVMMRRTQYNNHTARRSPEWLASERELTGQSDE